MRKRLISWIIAAGVALPAGAWAQTPAPTPAPPASTPAPAAPAAPAAPGAAKIGFVDVQRVLARSAAGVAAREQLERDKATMQKEMDGKRQELDKLRDELEKKGPLMTADARREKQDTFERKRRDAARLADDFQKELEKKEQGLLQRVLQDLSGVIERVCKQRGYFLVVERRGASVLYAAAEADLTDDVIRAYDQETGPKGKK
jgi:outer membrane protein